MNIPHYDYAKARGTTVAAGVLAALILVGATGIALAQTTAVITPEANSSGGTPVATTSTMQRY